VSLNDGSKKVENGESLILFCSADVIVSTPCYVCRAWVMCRDLLGTATHSIATAYSAGIVSKITKPILKLFQL